MKKIYTSFIFLNKIKKISLLTSFLLFISLVNAFSITVNGEKDNVCPEEVITYSLTSLPYGTTRIDWTINADGVSIDDKGNPGNLDCTNCGTTRNIKFNKKIGIRSATILVTAYMVKMDGSYDKLGTGGTNISILQNIYQPNPINKVYTLDVMCTNTNPISLSVTNDPDATSYEWVLPSGWSGSSSKNIITVTPTAITGGIVKVRAKSICSALGYSDYRELTINRTTPTIALDGPTSLGCGSTSSITYTSTAIPGASYAWKIPSGWSGSSTTNSISVTPDGTSVGDVEVTATLTCDGTAKTTVAKKTVALDAVPSGLTLDNYGAGSRPVTCTNSMAFGVSPTDPSWTYKWSFGEGVGPRTLGPVGNVSSVFCGSKPTTYGYNGKTWVQVDITNACGIKIATLRKEVDYEGNPPFAVSNILCSSGCILGPPAPPEITVDREAELYVSTIAAGGFNTKYTQYIWDICDGPWTYSSCYAARGVKVINQGSDRIKITVPYSISGSPMWGTKTLKVTAKNDCGEKVYMQSIYIRSGSSFTAYPSPASTGTLTLERKSEFLSTEWKYKIYNSFGEVVRQGIWEGENTTLTVSTAELPKGFYYIIAQDGKEMHRQSIQVE